MEARIKAMLTFGVLILIIFGLYFFTDWFSKITGYAPGEDEREALAKCLTKKNAIFYFSSTCPACDKQLKIFGETAADFLTKYECENADDCPASGGVPAWEMDNKFYYNVKNFNELKKISGCE